jgi:hypothetical protein
VSALGVFAPPANHRIELADQLCGAKRDATPRLPADSLLEPVDRLLRRIRVEIPTTDPGLDQRRRQRQPMTAALDLIAEECEPVTHVHNPCLLRIDPYAQRRKDLFRTSPRRFCLTPTPARDHPVVGIPRQLVSSPAHLPIERRQENIAQQGGDYTSYKVAKRVIEFSASIPRAHLRPGYGDGFLGAPLQAGLPGKLPTGREQGDRRGTPRTPTQHDGRSARHVCTEPAQPGLCGPGI